MARNELILLPSLTAGSGSNGGWMVSRKYLEGAAEYANTWPGPITSLFAIREDPFGHMDTIEVNPGQSTTALERRPAAPRDFVERVRGAGAVVALLCRAEVPTLALCRAAGVPLVYVSEYSLNTRFQIIAAEQATWPRQLRRRLWTLREDRMLRRVLPGAAGLQTSGTPTFEAYGMLQPNTLLFFDNRVREADILSPEGLTRKRQELLAGRPLRLVFGGRLVAMKGAQDLPRVAAELVRLKVAFTLDVVGAGPLEEPLRAEIAAAGLADCVRLLPPMDFATGWIPMLKMNADLFVCPHPQGDPSSTYVEVMSCGVPIVGYGNEAFTGIATHAKSGFITDVGDPVALAHKIAGLDGDRSALAAAAANALSFAAEHAFEHTFARRAGQLVAVAQHSDPDLERA